MKVMLEVILYESDINYNLIFDKAKSCHNRFEYYVNFNLPLLDFDPNEKNMGKMQN